MNKAEPDKENLKTTYNNYFLQVQTLMNQKAIKAPGEKEVVEVLLTSHSRFLIIH